MNKLTLALLIVLLGFLSIASISDNDIWFHLKTGEWILKHHALPLKDVFSYTASSPTWMAQSWLSQIVFFIVFHLSGFPGLILFKALVIMAAFILLYVVLVQRGADETIAALVVFLTAVLSRERFVERPHIFSFLFLSAYLYLLNQKGRRWRWVIVPLQLLWTNMHADHVLGILLCVVYVGWEMYLDSRLRGNDKGRTGNDSLFLLSVIAAAFLTPFTWRSPFYGLIAFNSGDAIFKYIIEMQPITFATVFRPFWVYTAAAAILMAYDPRRRFPEVLTSAALLFLTVKIRRFMPEFLIVSAPAVASGLSYLLEKIMDSRFRGNDSRSVGNDKYLRWVIFIIMVFITFEAIEHQEPRMRPGLGVNKDALPVGAAEFVARHHLKGRMFNPMRFGGYLLWRLHPQKVFMDGNGFDPQLMAREVRAYEPEVWKGLMDEYHFDFAILDNMDILGQYPARVLDEDPNWTLVYFDDAALIYARKDGADAALAKAQAYSDLKPNAPDLSYLDTIPDRKALKDQLRRAIQETPSLTAEVMLARVEEKDGDVEGAKRVLEQAVHDYPRVAGVRVLLQELESRRR
jgi:hypothetical protein